MSMTLEELTALVAKMRELGVVEACGVRLGPLPTTFTDEERAAIRLKREKDRAEREKDRADYETRIAFAATPWRPR